MYCTSCKVDGPSDTHYTTEFHAFNVKRKVDGLEPISQDQFIQQQTTTVDEEVFDDPSSEVDSIRMYEYKDKGRPQCIFCSTDDASPAHYHYKHSMSFDSIDCIISHTCYECGEKFINDLTLKKHIQSGIHSNIYFNGVGLVCPNGKMLYMNIFKHNLLLKKYNPEKKIVYRKK